MEERRRFIRWDVALPVTYRIADSSDETRCTCRDINYKGMCLCVDELIDREALLFVNVNLYGSGPINTVGKITWQKETDGVDQPRFLAGVRFPHLSNTQKDSLFNYLFHHERDQVVQQWREGVA